jgi:hypothetical protein
MGWLARLKGVAAPNTRVSVVRNELGRARGSRVPMYQNDKRIGQEYEQRLPNVTEVLAEVGLSVKVSGGVAGIVTAGGDTTQSEAQTIQMTPLLQALLLEESERELGTLVDLSIDAPKAGSLLRFVGAGRIFLPSQEVTELPHPELRVSPEDAQAIQAAREQQQKTMEEIGQSDTGTAVWIGRGSLLLASIASVSWLDPGNFRSYLEVPPFGILGKLEKSAGEAALLAPLLIWHDIGVGEAAASRPAAD